MTDQQHFVPHVTENIIDATKRWDQAGLVCVTANNRENKCEHSSTRHGCVTQLGQMTWFCRLCGFVLRAREQWALLMSCA